MDKQFRKATASDASQIWQIFQSAIERRKNDGSNQWQDGYPNPEVIANDIEKGNGYVLVLKTEIVGYVAILINDEPEYARLNGKWLSNNDFVVFHRVAIAQKWLGKGLAKELFFHIEEFARSIGINSIKADTNFDNVPMIHLFETLGYKYCGEVHFRGSPRLAYEKLRSDPL